MPVVARASRYPCICVYLCDCVLSLGNCPVPHVKMHPLLFSIYFIHHQNVLCILHCIVGFVGIYRCVCSIPVTEAQVIAIIWCLYYWCHVIIQAEMEMVYISRPQFDQISPDVVVYAERPQYVLICIFFLCLHIEFGIRNKTEVLLW